MNVVEKLVIEGVPPQALNFVKHYCQLVGDNEEQFWRRAVACEVDRLADLIAPGKYIDVLKTWDLEYAIKSLNTPRGPELRKIDEELWRLHEQDRIVNLAKAREKKRK